MTRRLASPEPKERIAERDARVMELHRGGLRIYVIAERMGLSRTAVAAIIRRCARETLLR